MTNQATTSKALPHGLNETAFICFTSVCPGAVTSGGTWTITPGDGIDITTELMFYAIWRPGTPNSLLYPVAATGATQLASITFDPTTGTIVITNGTTALQAGDIFYGMAFINN